MSIDLHVHSNASDGTQPPADVVRRAHANGVQVLALTDHDTVAGYPAARAALPPGMTLVRGMELSCRLDGRSLHMLAYLFDPGEPELEAERGRIADARVGRARGMVDRLRELGVDVTWDQVVRLADGGEIGRPHIARAMVAANAISTVEEAFTPDWIGTGGRARVERYALDPVRAVKLIRGAGGVAVLAHPRATKRGYVFGDDVITDLAAAGLAGIEVDHPDHAPEDRAHLRGLAADLHLVPTGSSDDHGELTGHRLGCETTAPQAYEALVAGATGGKPDQ